MMLTKKLKQPGVRGQSEAASVIWLAGMTMDQAATGLVLQGLQMPYG